MSKMKWYFNVEEDFQSRLELNLTAEPLEYSVAYGFRSPLTINMWKNEKKKIKIVEEVEKEFPKIFSYLREKGVEIKSQEVFSLKLKAALEVFLERYFLAQRLLKRVSYEEEIEHG